MFFRLNPSVSAVYVCISRSRRSISLEYAKSVTVQAVGLADAYDALVSQRVYKPAYTHAEALAMIRRGECGAFDPLLVDCLEDIQGALCREVYGLRGKE